MLANWLLVLVGVTGSSGKLLSRVIETRPLGINWLPESVKVLPGVIVSPASSPPAVRRGGLARRLVMPAVTRTTSSARMIREILPILLHRGLRCGFCGGMEANKEEDTGAIPKG